MIFNIKSTFSLCVLLNVIAGHCVCVALHKDDYRFSKLPFNQGHLFNSVTLMNWLTLMFIKFCLSDILKFDNSHSWSRSKEVFYSVKLLPPGTKPPELGWEGHSLNSSHCSSQSSVYQDCSESIENGGEGACGMAESVITPQDCSENGSEGACGIAESVTTPPLN